MSDFPLEEEPSNHGKLKPTDFLLEEEFLEEPGFSEEPRDFSEEPDFKEREITPLAEENNKIAKNIDYLDFYNKLLLEVCDIERGLHDIQKSFTEALLRRGININPQAAYQQLTLATSRMVKILVAKRMVMAFGLQGEYDTIMEHEMNLVYGNPQVNKPQRTATVPIVGEVNRSDA
mgnify:CR=1 FL=1